MRVIPALIAALTVSLFAADITTTDSATTPATETLTNPTATPVRPSTKAEIDKGELLGHIKYLSSPELHGREAGSPDQVKVAQYIASEFDRYGLEPFGDVKDGKHGYLQEFPIVAFKGLGKNSELEVTIKGDATKFEMRKQFLPIATGYQPLMKADAPVAFAGYAIIAPELNYDDFANVDLAGKWALVLRYEPSAFMKGKEHSKHAALSAKVLNCSVRRAAGVLLVTGPLGFEKEKDEDLLGRGVPGIIGDFNIPMLHITQALADQLLAPTDKKIGDLQRAIEKEHAGQSFVIPDVKVRGVADIQVERRMTDNVIGRLAGSDPSLKNEIVVVGAHCDHVGLGYEGSLSGKDGEGKIHPGADDNASGTAGMLEIAQYVASLKDEQRPKRTVLFMAYSGEEKGLLGSKYFVDHPTIDVKQIDAMLNLDMIGRSSDGGIQVSGVRTGKGFKELVTADNAEFHFNLHVGGAGDGPSDHATFFHKNIPVLFFFTGTHADYHRPTDTWEKINAPVAADTARLAAKILLDLANRPERAMFTQAASGAFLGITPDQEKSKRVKGYPIASVAEGSPAENAGLQSGDVIVELNGQALPSPLDLMMSLTEFSPGDTIDLKIQRGENMLTAHVTVAARGKANRK